MSAETSVSPTGRLDLAMQRTRSPNIEDYGAQPSSGGQPRSNMSPLRRSRSASRSDKGGQAFDREPSPELPPFRGGEVVVTGDSKQAIYQRSDYP